MLLPSVLVLRTTKISSKSGEPFSREKRTKTGIYHRGRQIYIQKNRQRTSHYFEYTLLRNLIYFSTIFIIVPTEENRSTILFKKINEIRLNGKNDKSKPTQS